MGNCRRFFRKADENEKEEKQLKPSFGRHVLAAFLGCTNGILTGLNIGYTSVGLDSLQHEALEGKVPFQITPREVGMFGSCLNLTSMLGAILSGYIAEKFGRKWPSVITLIPYSIGWALMIKPTSFQMMLAGQLLCGFFQGLRAPIGRMYMAETSHPLYRGEFLSSITMLVMAGSLMSYVSALFLNWQFLAIGSMAIPFILLPITMALPESHVWLISKGRYEEARKSWRWFRGGEYCDAVGDKEYKDSVLHYEETKEAANSWRDILQFHYLKPVIIIVVSLLLRHFCGNTAIMFFMSQIFTMSKSGVEPRYAVIILGFIQLVFIIISGRLMDRIGRRKSTVISSIIMGFSQIGMGAYFYFDEHPQLRAIAERFNWLPLVFLSTCMIGYSLGIASIAIILSGEIVPIQIKNSTNGIINFFNKGFAYVALETFYFFLEAMNASGTFWMYAACCFILAVYFLLVLPETKGQSLQDIERKLTDHRKSSSDGSLSSVSTVVTLSIPSAIVEDEKASCTHTAEKIEPKRSAAPRKA